MRSRRAAIRVAISVASALIMAGIFAGTGNAGAITARSGSVEVAIAPTSRVADGQSVVIRAASAPGVQIYQLRAHLCRPGAPVRTNFDFGFQGRRCANVAVGHGDLEQTAEFGNGVYNATLKSFKVGVGSVHWVNELGFDQTQVCGPGHPCDLVVRVQITDDTLFFTTPVCYGSTCPAATPDPAVLVPTPTSTSTTVHPPTVSPATNATGAANTPAVGGTSGSPSGSNGSSSRRVAVTGAAAAAASANGRRATGANGPVCDSRSPADSVAAAKIVPPVAPSGGLSQTQRMLLAALAGALGSAWIVSIFLRGRALLVPGFARKELTW